MDEQSFLDPYLKDDALEITAYLTLTIDGTAIPTVCVNAANRPDIVDLERVQRSEGGVGEVQTVWYLNDKAGDMENSSATLTVEYVDPVATSFKLVFPLYSPYLKRIHDARRIALSTQTKQEIAAAASRGVIPPALIIPVEPLPIG